MEMFMEKVRKTKIGDSMSNDDVLCGPMLSEKYAVDFLDGLEMCESSGATRIYGEGRITADSSPTGFVDDADSGVYMRPHAYANVTDEKECFHEELYVPAVKVVKPTALDHALYLANASPLRLSSAIYTND